MDEKRWTKWALVAVSASGFALLIAAHGASVKADDDAGPAAKPAAPQEAPQDAPQPPQPPPVENERMPVFHGGC